MLPILLISKDYRDAKKYIRNFIKKSEVHPSRIFEILKEKTTISIGQIREVQGTISRLGAEKTIVIIHDFDTAKKEAQNAFLKTLEEGGKFVQFILLVSDQTNVLPTIQSRSTPVKLKEKEITYKYLEKYGFSDPALSKTHALDKSSFVKKEHTIKILDELISIFHRHITKPSPKNIAQYARAAEKTYTMRALIQNNNLNAEHSTDRLLFDLYDDEVFPLSAELTISLQK